MRYSIDITESYVRVVKFNAKGIKQAGTADYDTEHLPGSTEYMEILSAALKRAARAAGIPRGSGIICTAVAGGPEVVIRRFNWPEMPASALYDNAVSEFAPFLPGPAETFSIGYEIAKRNVNEETGAVTLDVIVAALPLDFIDAIKRAAKKSGLKITSVDVRENSRVKLISRFCTIGENGAAPQSYALLDFSQNRANMGLYLNGAFYSNRYFGSGMLPEEPLFEEIEYDENGEPLPQPPKPPPSKRLRYDPGTLANDVVSIVEYMEYRERGSSLECILLVGEHFLPGIEEALAESLDIPIYTTEQWLRPGLAKGVKLKKGETDFSISSYLDAFGAALASRNTKESLKLRGTVKPSAAKNVALPMLGVVAVVAVLVFGIIYYYGQQVTELEARLAQLQREGEFFAIGSAGFGEISSEVALLQGEKDAVLDFREEFIHPYELLPLLFDTTIEGRLWDPLHIASFNLNGDRGNIRGNAQDFYHVADAVDAYLSHPLIEHTAITGGQHPGANQGEARISFDLPLTFGRSVEEYYVEP